MEMLEDLRSIRPVKVLFFMAVLESENNLLFVIVKYVLNN